MLTQAQHNAETAAAARGPFRVLSTKDVDTATLARLAPGFRSSLRLAAGVCTDAQKYCKGRLFIIDARGDEVDEDAWRPGLRAAREASMSPR